MAGKIQISADLKNDLPQNQWGKILAATPIFMTVIATMLAGLASSEMTKAQYDRAFAAQLQSKAGDQWGYYQAKKLRSALAHNNMDLLAATGQIRPLSPSDLPGADPATIAALAGGKLPEYTVVKFPEDVQTALNEVEAFRPESEVAATLIKVKPATLAGQLAAAQNATMAFDSATKSINKAVDKFDETLMTGDRELFRSFTAARLRYTAERYDAESRLNMAVAGIYELQVRQNNYSAEKHHTRSKSFFFGMLAAQLAVIVSTFAIAARKHNILWSLAAGAGAVAVAFSIYVYLCV